MSKVLKRELGFEVKKSVDSNGQQVDGIFMGTLLEYNVVDKMGDNFLPTSITNASGETVFLLYEHDTEEVIGKATIIKTNTGIDIQGQLFIDVNQRAKEIFYGLQQGLEYKLSVGCTINNYTWNESGGLDIASATIFEASVCMRGIQEGAEIYSYKSARENIKNEGEVKMAEVTEVKKSETEVTEVKQAEESGTVKVTELQQEQNQAIGETEVQEVRKSVETMKKQMEAMDIELKKSQAPKARREEDLEVQKSDFNAFIRSGGKELRKSMSTSQNAVAMPRLVSENLWMEIPYYVAMMNYVNVMTGAAPIMTLAIRRDRINAVEKVAEGAAGVVQSETRLDEIQIPVSKIKTTVEITKELIEDSTFDFNALINQSNAEDFGEIFESGIVKGMTGVFEGIYQNADMNTNAIVTVDSGKIGYDDFMNLEMSLKPSDRQQGVYYASNKGILSMKTMKDDQKRPLWQPSLIQGQPNMFNGYPVIEVASMDAIAVGKLPVMFANLKRLYTVYKRQDFEVSTFFDGETDVNKIWTTCRIGGKVIRPLAGNLLKIKA